MTGRVVLVPEARVGRNVLADILARQGAEVRTFPTLEGRPPRDLEPLDRAATRLDRYRWVVFSGGMSARVFLERFGRGELTPRVATIGMSAAKELRRRGLTVHAKPREHTAEAVAEALGDLHGAEVLLIRGDRASPKLPAALAERGAAVTDLVGFEVSPRATRDEVAAALAYPLELVALGNPSSLRILIASFDDLGLDLERCLAGVAVAAVGPATARAAAEAGLEPDLVSGGHLAHLMRDLKAL